MVGSLAEASKRVGFDIVAPPGLGAPTTVAVTREGRVVELTWGTGAGSTRLDVFDGSLSFGYLKSVWQAVTPTDVDGKEAVWFAAPHLIEWTDRAGVTVASAPRSPGPPSSGSTVTRPGARSPIASKGRARSTPRR